MQHRRSSNFHRAPQRRQLVWATTFFAVSPAAGVQTSVQLNSGLLQNLPGFTVIRTHVRMQVPFVGITDKCTIGLIVGRNSDVGTIRPDVTGEPELDWMHLEQFYPAASGAAVDTLQVITVDNHSKRKMDEPSQVYMLSIKNGNAAAAAYVGYARVLFALP